jgi:hypothetical protein
MDILVRKWDDDDCLQHQIIYIDGERRLEVHPGEPEDAIIGRDLIASAEIIPLMRLAYEAGMVGENFEVKQINGEEE